MKTAAEDLTEEKNVVVNRGPVPMMARIFCSVLD
jgi:hypothetical protein